MKNTRNSLTKNLLLIFSTVLFLMTSCCDQNTNDENTPLPEVEKASKRIVATENAPKAIGPYSQAVAYGDLLFVSGSLAIDPTTGKFVDGDIKEQTTVALKNIKAILESEGLDMSNVLKSTCLLADINDYKAMNEVYAQFFTEKFPARAAFQVANLPLGAKIEIEVIAGR